MKTIGFRGTSHFQTNPSGNLKPSKLGNFNHGQMQTWVVSISLLRMSVFSPQAEIIPSGEHTKSYGKWPFLMGKLTISTGPFSIAVLVQQRV